MPIPIQILGQKVLTIAIPILLYKSIAILNTNTFYNTFVGAKKPFTRCVYKATTKNNSIEIQITILYNGMIFILLGYLDTGF